MDLSGLDDWPEHLQSEAKEMLKRNARVFSKTDMDMGRTNLVKHHIKLTDPVPFKESYRRIPPQMYDEVKAHIQEMLDLGAIRPSNSPWASAIVLVRKKDGRLRFCIDLRRLNNRTVKDAYSLPKIESILDSLIGAQIFSTLDLKAGYWQVEMAEECKAYTAFTCGPLGFYECDTMPFGATNAPATFQRLMHDCLGDLNLNWCIVYLDDIIIFSDTKEEHLKRSGGDLKLQTLFEKDDESADNESETEISEGKPYLSDIQLQPHDDDHSLGSFAPLTTVHDSYSHLYKNDSESDGLNKENILVNEILGACGETNYYNHSNNKEAVGLMAQLSV